MKCLTLDIFQDFKCIGTACSNTCCAGWKITVDEQSAAYYRSIEGEFGKKLNDGLTVINDSVCMKLNDSKCPFLTDKQLCEIYINLGEDKMCKTCKTYPRTYYECGGVAFYGMSISCPEVARMLIEHTDLIQFDFGENATPPPVSSEPANWTLFNILIQGMITSMGLIQNRNLSLSSRLRLLVLLTDSLQEHLDSGKDCSALFQTFSTPSDYMNLTTEFDLFSKGNSPKISFITHFFKRMNNRITALFTNARTFLDTSEAENSSAEIDQGFECLTSPEYDLQYEQFCVYFLLFYYMRSHKKGNPQKYITLLVYMYCLQLCSGAFIIAGKEKTLSHSRQIHILSCVGRAMEHSVDSNNNTIQYDVLYDSCKENGMADTAFLLSLLS